MNPFKAFAKIAPYALMATLFSALVFGQQNPGLFLGQVPTAAQWNSYFSVKADVEPQGRLTLSTGTPIMSANVTATSTVYYDCLNGNSSVLVYNGTSDVQLAIPNCEISTVMQTTGTGVLNNAGVFDIWGVNPSGTTLVICVATNGTGGGWASDGGSNTARGTGYSQIDQSTRNYITNANSITHCYNGSSDQGPVSANQATYLGTLYTTAAGQTGMNFQPTAVANGNNSVLGLFNGYNRVPVSVWSRDSTSQWTYTSATWRAVRGQANNSVNYVDGLKVNTVAATYVALGSSASTTDCSTGVNRDSTSATPANTSFLGPPGVTVMQTAWAQFLPLAGFHTLTAMEYADGSTCTFNGPNPVAGGQTMMLFATLTM